MPSTGLFWGRSSLPAHLLAFALLFAQLPRAFTSSLARWSEENLCPGAMTQLLAWVGANQAPGLTKKKKKTLVWGHKAGRSTPAWVLWPEPATMLVLQISKAICWDYYLATEYMDSVDQDPCAGCCKPLPSFSVIGRVLVVECYRCPAIPETRVRTRGEQPIILGVLVICPRLFH